MATFTVEQDGTEFEVESISYQGQTVEEFYNYGGIRASADTPTEIEAGADESKIFVYEGPEGVSLVLIHDYHGFPDSTESGGRTIFEFDSLPNGEWVVKDDPGDWDRSESSPPERIKWFWNNRNPDGGAYRFDSGGSLTVDPEFKSGIDTWSFLSESASDPVRTDLALDESITIEVPDSTARELSLSTTVISFVPGREDEFLFPDDSAFPDESQLFRTVDIPLIGDVRLRESAPKPDAFYGDGVRAETEGVGGGLSSSLDNALNQTKTVSEPQINEVSGEFKSRRISNTLNLTYTTDSEGDVDLSEEITVEVNVESPIDEVQSLPIRLVVTGEGLPDTIVHDEDYYIVLDESGTRFPDPSPVPIENFSDSQRKPPTTFDRHLHATIDQLKNPSGDVLNAVRLSTIWGAVNSYFEDILNNLDEFGEIFSIPNLGELLPVPPNPIVYTWIEVALLTDGTKYVRIPDASLFPRHELYVDGAKQRTSGFITSEDATDGGYSARYNEDKNNVWEEFKRESDTGTGFVPYRSPHSLYINQFEESDTPDSFPGHPVMVYGEDGQGNPIGGELDIDEILGEPLDPFSNAG